MPARVGSPRGVVKELADPSLAVVRCLHAHPDPMPHPGSPPGRSGLMSAVSTVGRTRHRRAWVRIFFGGLGLWIASVVVTFVTQNPNLVPTVILLGSSLLPVPFV